MVENLSPSKLIQCKKNFAPWLNSEFFKNAKIRDELYTKATKTNNKDDWRLYRRHRNLCNNINKQCKKTYFTNKLNKINNDNDECCSDDKDDGNDSNGKNGNNDDRNSDVLKTNSYSDKGMWRCVREMTNKCKQQLPRILKINGIFTTLLR